MPAETFGGFSEQHAEPIAATTDTLFAQLVDLALFLYAHRHERVFAAELVKKLDSTHVSQFITISHGRQTAACE